MTVQCSVCKAGVSVARYVDASPDLTAAALSRQASAVGMDLSAERILTHRKHRASEEPAKIAKTKRDFAALVRDKAVEQFEAGQLDLRDKDHAPGIGRGLQAQGLLDKREQTSKGKGNAELAFAIIKMLRGETPEPLALDDGNTIEGEYEVVGATD